jgi:hypothetical protein
MQLSHKWERKERKGLPIAGCIAPYINDLQDDDRTCTAVGYEAYAMFKETNNIGKEFCFHLLSSRSAIWYVSFHHISMDLYIEPSRCLLFASYYPQYILHRHLLLHHYNKSTLVILSCAPFILPRTSVLPNLPPPTYSFRNEIFVTVDFFLQLWPFVLFKKLSQTVKR